MKARNLLLATLCLLAFLAIGLFAFRFGANRKPFGVILFLADGFGPNLVAASRLFEGGADHRLALETMPAIALLRNASADSAVPDEAASASAIATGQLTANGFLSSGPGGASPPSLLEIAKQKGRATGLVTDGELAAPGTAAFYTHAGPDAKGTDLALDLIEKARIDLVMGGGGAPFVPVSKGGLREDGRDLLIEAKDRGTALIRQKNEMEGLPAFRMGPALGVFSMGRMAFRDEAPERAAQPSLSEMVRHAIRSLQSHPGGYFLVVDAALPGRAAYARDGERAIASFLEFDQALGVARRYAGEKSVVVAAGRASIGGLTLNGYPRRQDWGVALVGTNPLGYQSITWSGGPLPGDAAPPTSAPHHAGDILSVGSGPGTERLRGILDNRELFDILAGQL